MVINMLVELKVGDEVKGSERMDPSDLRFRGVKGVVVDIKGPRIWVDFHKDALPARVMYRHELVKIPSKRG